MTDLRTPPVEPGNDKPLSARLRVLLQPGWLLVILLAIAFAGACWTILAPWQFSRAAEREAQNAAITSAVASPAVPVTDLLSTTDDPDPSVAWKLASATGTFAPDDQVFVRLRQLNGRPAFEVLAPFTLTDGTRLLTDRGYVSTDAVANGYTLPPLPAGTVTILARTQVEQPYPSPRESVLNDGRTEVYGITTDRLRADGTPTLRGFVQLIDSSPGVIEAVGVPQVDGGPYLSYAYQWITFGAAAFAAICFFVYREVVDPLDEDDDAGPDKPGKSRNFNKADLYD